MGERKENKTGTFGGRRGEERENLGKREMEIRLDAQNESFTKDYLNRQKAKPNPRKMMSK